MICTYRKLIVNLTKNRVISVIQCLQKEEITYFSLKREIEQKQFRPIYVLQGEEPYYIDKLCGLIVDNALTEDEKALTSHYATVWTWKCAM